MKVAIAHDYLNQYGGAERVLESLLKIFPDAHVYTLLYDRERTLGKFDKNVYQTSFLDRPIVRKNHRPFIPLMPGAASLMTVKSDYDLVISATAGYAKGVSIRHKDPKVHNPYHISYCYTPLRYAWEIDNYFENPVFKTIFRPAFSYLKSWDKKASQRPDKIIAISNFIAKKVGAYYGRQAEVVYPPVDTKKFFYEKKAGKKKEQPGYYLAAGRLLHYKKFDLIIDVFLKLGLFLKIAGVGPELEKMRSQISYAKNIELIGFVDDNELRKLYREATALIFPQVEDFGLVAAEAQACGTPVVAFRGGGAEEIVKEGISGVFFGSQTAESLADAVRKSETMRWDRKKISSLSNQFSDERFAKEFISKIPEKFF